MEAKKVISFMLTLVMMATMVINFGITAYADTAYIDPTNDSVELEQQYYLHVYDGEYTDVKKVKIDWSIYGIGVYRHEAKKWNPDTLQWEADHDNDEIEKYSSTSYFTVTNLSSKKVQVMIDFTAEEQFHPTVSFSGVDEETHKVVLNTVVKSDKTVDKTINNKASISVEVNPANDFATLEETDGTKYGTFTITLCDYCDVEEHLMELQQEFIDIFGKETLDEVLALTAEEFYSKVSYENEQYNTFADKYFDLPSEDYDFKWVSALDDGTVEVFDETHSYRLEWLTRVSCKEHPSVSIIVSIDG